MKKPTIQPPRWARRLLHGFCAPHLLEEMESDLDELFQKRIETVGPTKARWRYIRDVLSLMRPFIMKRQLKEYPNPNCTDMLRNYLLIAWRKLAYSTSFSFLNGSSLMLGMACALLIFLVVKHETSYDQHHKNGERIYRVETVNASDPFPHAGTYTEMAPVLRNEVPEIERVVSIHQEWAQPIFIPAQGKAFKENVAFADPDLFNLLDYQWVAGKAHSALAGPNQVVLTESCARKFFGTVDGVGKTIQYGNGTSLLVTGILKDHPTTTNFPFQVLVSFPTLKRVYPDFDSHGWSGFGDNYQVFVLLRQGIRPEQLAARFHAIQVKYQKDPRTVQNQHFRLNPLEEIHYAFNFSGRQASPELLNILALIGAFVLLIACINFINLSTAKSLKRAKEVGIRKAVGSNRLALIGQFLTEAGLITLLASLLAMLLAWAALSATANLMGLPLKTSDLFSWQVGAFMLVLFLLTTLLAGTYPAFRLSGMSPIWALKRNQLPHRDRLVSLRQGLVVVQFAISMVLISSTLFINRQLSLFQQADLGFNKNALITLSLPDNEPTKLQTLRNQLLASPQIKEVSFSLNSPSAESNWMAGMEYRKARQPVQIKTQMKMVDAHFLSTYGIQLIAGEAFREGDTLSKVIANEVFVKRMGIDRPEKAIGQLVHFGEGNQSAPIIGVVKTFHVNSLHQGIDPTLLLVEPKHFYQAGIKLHAAHWSPETLKATLATIQTAFPNKVFEYEFLDQTLAQAYHNETRTAHLIQTATLVAILIACLGLFGLAAFMAESRTKEIGVRKVLGASLASIVALLSKDFLKPVLAAIVLASPLAWYAIKQWLENFQYKTPMDWWVFVLAGSLAIVVALLTVSVQSVKTARMNPTRSLRSE